MTTLRFLLAWTALLWGTAVATVQTGCSPLSYDEVITKSQAVLQSTEGALTITAIRYNCFAYTPPDVTKLRSFVVSINATKEYSARVDFVCSPSGSGFVASLSAFPFLFSNLSSDSYCAHCLFTSEEPCEACNAKCLKDRCYGSAEADCCNHFLPNTSFCTVNCQGHFAANGTQDDCICSNFYNGTNCTDCSLTCENGGTVNANCSACACPNGFSGVKCDVPVDLCASNPCMNGGLCINTIDSYTCNCTGNWTGSTCSNCSLLCSNHGTADAQCSSCNCTGSWKGSTCEECNVVCQHGSGNADCSGCKCIGNWTGLQCDVCNVVCQHGYSNASTNCSGCNCYGNWTGLQCEACRLIEGKNNSCSSPCYEKDYLPDDINGICYACGLLHCKSCNYPADTFACRECTDGAKLKESDDTCYIPKSTNTTGIVVGVIVAVFCLIVILAVGIYCWRKHNSEKGGGYSSM